MNKLLKYLIVAVLVSANNNAMSQNEPPIHESQPVDHPDKEAQFPGGNKAFQTYVTNHMNYPYVALKQNVQGTVYLSFTVEADGKIRNVKVIRGVSLELDYEATRLVKAMPPWIPGETQDKKVASLVMVPIHFKIE